MEAFTSTIWFWLIGFTVMMAIGSIDVYASLKFPNTGQEEGVSYHKDKYGFFSLAKSMRTLSIFVGLTVALMITAQLTEPHYTALSLLTLLPVPAHGLAYGLNNLKNARYNRERQIKDLDTNFARYTNEWGQFLVPLEKGGGRWRFRLFPWVYIEPVPKGMTDDEARSLLLTELKKMALLDKSTRFTKEFFELTTGPVI